MSDYNLTHLKQLEADDLLDKTIIFFWSDHGGPLLRQKRCVGNTGLHVPLIVRFPDQRMAGTKVEDIVSLMDLGPTVMSLADVKPPAYMHGKAFLGAFKSDGHRYAFGHADRFDEYTGMSRSVLDGRYVYIKNFRPHLPYTYRNKYRENIEMTSTLLEMDRNGQLSGDAAYIFSKSRPVEELYDLQNDPDELHNLAADNTHRKTLMRLRKALFDWQLEVGDLGFIPEAKLVEMFWPGGVQPLTVQVSQKYEKGLLKLSCPTKGASIGYQVNEDIGSESWQLYSKPLKLKKGTKVCARAVRLGYRTSSEQTWILGES